MSGFGTSPFGSSPYGTGTPDAAPIQGGALFRNPLTGESLTGRRIDPATGDYSVDAYGRILGMTAGQQAVYLAMKTSLGSAAMTALGNDVLAIKTVTSDFANAVRSKVLAALDASIRAGLISRVSVDVTSNGSRGFAVVRWLDESSKTEQELIL